MTIELVLSDKEQRRFWSRVTLPDSDGCMLWTGAINSRGYGHSKLAGSFRTCHRVSLYFAVGTPAQDGMHAAHSCRNKHCVAPAHLRWATAKENEADKSAQGVKPLGERVGSAKLTDMQAQAIRMEAASGATNQDLRARYGVSRQTIRRLINGETYQPTELSQAGAR